MLKRTVLAGAFFLSLGLTTAVAQIPAEGINYQAVARNAQGNPITSAVTVRISILSGSATGPVQYQETHSVTPNVYGIFNLTIGQGTPTNGTFSTINWGGAAHFSKTEINTGSGYVDMGTSQLWAVPYALYAETSGNSGTTYTAGSGINIAGNSISAVDNSITNELQNLTVSGSTLSISNGNSVTLPTGTGTDSQTLSLSGNTLSISNGNSVTLPAGSGTDSQTLTLTGNTLAISNGNSVTLPTGTTYTAGSGISITGTTIAATDNSTTNEIQSLTLTGTTLSISGGNSVNLPTGTTYTAGSGISITGTTIAATDNSITNEIQSLTLTGTTLSISGGNSVTLPTGTTYTAGSGISITGTTISATDNSATNEIQSLSLSGNTLSISGGNSITLPAASGGGTLDQAYDFGGAGAGKTITADSGPVTINGSGAGTMGLSVTHNGTGSAAIGVNFSGTGNAIQVLASNPANTFAAIQATTASSTATNSAVFGQSTGAARAVSGQVEASATADVAVRGLNLRTSGGIGVEGVGFNGVSGATQYTGGFAVFGSNTSVGATGGTGSLGVGTYGAGFNGIFGQTSDVTNGYAGYFTADLGVEGTGYSIGGWVTASDRRLKTNIVPITGALDKLMKVNGTHYTITTGYTNLMGADGKATFGKTSHEQYGVIAQEVEAIFPEMVKEKAIFKNQGDQTVYKTVDYNQLVPVLIEAIKELKQEVETLKAEIKNK